MICPNCKYDNENGAVFCTKCGTKLSDPQTDNINNTDASEKTAPGNKPEGKKSNGWVIPVIIGAAVFVFLLAGIIAAVAVLGYKKYSAEKENIREELEEEIDDALDELDPFDDDDDDDDHNREETKKKKDAKSGSDKEKGEVKSLERAFIVDKDAEQYYDESLIPSVPEYKVKSDLSDIFNKDDIEYLPDSAKKKLAKDNFVVMDTGGFEFYDVYESNRYGQRPSFITVDSMMHTYHLYFSHLLKKLEKEDLYDELRELTDEMYEESVDQYGELKGSEWEDAALRNVAFFTVGSKLLGGDPKVLSDVKDVVKEELDLIEGGDINDSPLFGDLEDYSQYKPRGYYEGDETLEKYFRGMMWYGRRGFEQRDEDHMRSALLMTLAMKDEGLKRWEGIYTVTSFFAGASDDNTYYELEPVIKEAYGRIDDVSDLIGDTDNFDRYYELTKDMEPPQINSIPVWETDEENVISTFRFMGQRFSMDAAVFQKLMYRNVEENSRGDKRMLPDALDIPAALGSETAYEILDKQGDTDYEKYPETMDEIRKGIKEAENTDLWSASLYAQWLNTLRPLLNVKGKGYPMFMQSGQWNVRSLEGFLGSYAELKHDTILYSKQAMAEMGGGWDEEIDDRGYVEPEPVIYSRFAVLAENTMKGLKDYGMLDKDDKENLKRMADMAKQLVVISEKELKDEKLSDDEYLFIKDFGGDIEHLWSEAVREEGHDYPRSDEYPGAVVADIATDPNGSVLEVGTGHVDSIYVICPVDGTYRVCIGAVYSFYEFPWPMSDRLTDKDWRVKLGIWPVSGYDFEKDESIKQPEWTQGYRSQYEWNY